MYAKILMKNHVFYFGIAAIVFFNLPLMLAKIPFANNLALCLTFLQLDLIVVPCSFNFILLLAVMLFCLKPID